MSEVFYYVLSGIFVVSAAYFSARKAKAEGYFFWRTFFMSILGFTGIILLFLTMVL